MAFYELKNDVITLTVTSLGAEMKSLKNNKTGEEYLWQADPAYWGRTSPVLFPVVGSYKDKKTYYNGMELPSGQHGFARDLEFELISQTEDTLWFSLKDNADTYKNYPFHFELQCGYTIEENKVKVLWKVLNPSEETLHFSIGAHPAFNCPLKEGEKQADYSLLFDTDKPLVSSKLDLSVGLFSNETVTYETENGKLPITEKIFEYDTLVPEHDQVHAVSLLTPEGREYVKVTFDAPLFGIWTPIQKQAPFICIEPWYGRSDKADFNQQLTEREWGQKLEKDEVFEADYTIELN